jgi:hypothetical protein
VSINAARDNKAAHCVNDAIIRTSGDATSRRRHDGLEATILNRDVRVDPAISIDDGSIENQGAHTANLNPQHHVVGAKPLTWQFLSPKVSRHMSPMWASKTTAKTSPWFSQMQAPLQPVSSPRAVSLVHQLRYLVAITLAMHAQWS